MNDDRPTPKELVTMPEQSFPDVLLFNVDGIGYPHPPAGENVVLASTVPAIIVQAKREERERLRETALRGVAEIAALGDPAASTWPSVETDHARALVAAAFDRAIAALDQGKK